MGFATLTLPWPWLDGFRYLGFPLPGAAFLVRGDVWTDFVSNWILPSLLADRVLMSFFPRALVEICAGRGPEVPAAGP